MAAAAHFLGIKYYCAAGETAVWHVSQRGGELNSRYCLWGNFTVWCGVAFFVSLVFALGAYVLIRGTDVWRYAREALPEENTLAIGKLLLTEYMLPFELISVLLLAAMIGAIVLARGEKS